MNADEKERRKWVKTLHPGTVVWEITLACNMRCIHCGSSAGPLRKRPDELSTKEAIGLIRQLKEIGSERIVLSGGEPFLRKDWEVLAKEVAAVDMVPSFISNGFLLDEKKAERIKGLHRPDAHVGVSIDGDEKTHDYIRQTKGSFKKATRALEILKEKGIFASAVTQVNMLNFKLLPKIRDHIFKRGIYVWQIQLATPWGRLAENPKLLLTPQKYVKLVQFIVEQRKILGEMVVGADDIGYYTELEQQIRPKGEWRGCHAGLRTLGLTSNGNVTGCLSLQEPQFIEGNIRNRRLKDIWKDFVRSAPTV
jgi:MoaA/NifB/PqqE/SkfB family radical SAM enzyme